MSDKTKTGRAARPKRKPRKPVRFRCWVVIVGHPPCMKFAETDRSVAVKTRNILWPRARLVRGHFVEDRK